MATSTHQPLAERLRPRNLGEVIGQQHLLGPGMPLPPHTALPLLSRLIEISGLKVTAGSSTDGMMPY